jgi:hypothetical protein
VAASEVKTLATQTGQSMQQIGRKVAEIQSTTREAVASPAYVAEATDQVSTAIEQQRAGIENFMLSARQGCGSVGRRGDDAIDLADFMP